MENKEIISLQHPLVKHLVKLQSDSHYRLESQTLIVEGIKPIKELIPHVVKLFYTQNCAVIAHDFPVNAWKISEPILSKISSMISPEGLVAEVQMPVFGELKSQKRVLALDRVSDPGNMGVLMRTALAFGWNSIYLLPGCCDVFNSKVVRASRGALFKLQLIKGNAACLAEWIKQENVQALAAGLQGKSPEYVSSSNARLLVLGNEAKGLSREVQEFCLPVTLPMNQEMESLNVAVAGGILLYQLQGDINGR